MDHFLFFVLGAQNRDALQSESTQRGSWTRDLCISPCYASSSLSQAMSLISLDGSKVFSIRSSAQCVTCVICVSARASLELREVSPSGYWPPISTAFFFGCKIFSAQSFPQGDCACAPIRLRFAFLPLSHIMSPKLKLMSHSAQTAWRLAQKENPQLSDKQLIKQRTP